MSKLLFSGLLIATTVVSSINYEYSTTAVVTLIAGRISSAQSVDITTKYKRKDCPVCKGRGWYISGDGIKRIECQYCEPDGKDKPSNIIHN